MGRNGSRKGAKKRKAKRAEDTYFAPFVSGLAPLREIFL